MWDLLIIVSVRESWLNSSQKHQTAHSPRVAISYSSSPNDQLRKKTKKYRYLKWKLELLFLMTSIVLLTYHFLEWQLSWPIAQEPATFFFQDLHCDQHFPMSSYTNHPNPRVLRYKSCWPIRYEPWCCNGEDLCYGESPTEKEARKVFDLLVIYIVHSNA